jgi:hypothetical protein
MRADHAGRRDRQRIPNTDERDDERLAQRDTEAAERGRGEQDEGDLGATAGPRPAGTAGAGLAQEGRMTALPVVCPSKSL